jgi:hypothetical protein
MYDKVLELRSAAPDSYQKSGLGTGVGVWKVTCRGQFSHPLIIVEVRGHRVVADVEGPMVPGPVERDTKNGFLFVY